MLEVADILFRKVYQDTGSIEVAILELKRIGWSRHQTVIVITKVFEVTVDYASALVVESIAWQE